MLYQTLRLCIGCFSISIVLSTVEAADLSIDQVMTQQEQETIGVRRMDPRERAAFERWLDSWTKKVIHEAPSYHASSTLSQWVSTWPGYLQTAPIPKEEASQERQGDNQKIFRNMSGVTLELFDGSIWKPADVDQPTARFWARGQRIVINKNPQEDINRPYLLVNQQRQEQVGAIKTRSANPRGQRTPDNVSYFRGSSPAKSITSDGITIQLANGTEWIVAPTGQQLVQATWKIGDRIRAEHSSDAAYRYKLSNLDSGGSVLANPPNKNITPSYYQQ